MKFAIALVICFAIGLLSRFFDLPAPAPPVLPGALLVLATTLGYISGDRLWPKDADASKAPPAAVSPSAPPRKNDAGRPTA